MTANVSSPAVRVTDSEREAVVTRLHEAVGAGRLTLDEFDGRAERAYAARTVAELTALTTDLVPRPGPFPPRMTAPTAFGPPPVFGEPVVARFGAIEVTGTTVRTPSGSFPLAGSTWRTHDYWQTRRVTPGWAVALAVVGFFVIPFVSLLFLLVREYRTTGRLQIAVGDGLHQHMVELPVGSHAQVRAISQQVGYVQTLAQHA